MHRFIASCVCCTMLLAVPVAVFVLPKRDILEGERRKAAAFPDLPRKIFWVSEIKRFFSGFDGFFADHFPWRDVLLSLSVGWYELTGDNLDISKCYRGKENWLFLGNRWSRCVDKLQGRVMFSEKTLQRQVEYYMKMHNAARNNGARFVIFIGPNKSSVYPEYLPPFVTPAAKRFITPLYEALRKAGITVYDPTERLLNKKSDGLLYYRTDTHWNGRGAYEAFKGFKEYIGLPLLPSCTFVAGSEYRGDLVNIGGFKRFPLSKGDNDAPRWDPPLSHAISEKTAWIFGDSFAQALKIYMQATFERTTFFSHNKFEQMMSSHNQKPDLIIWVVVERSFAE